MSDMTIDQARIQIIAQEAAEQKATDLRRIADLRVQILQYEQEVNRLRDEVARLNSEAAADQTPKDEVDTTTESGPDEAEGH